MKALAVAAVLSAVPATALAGAFDVLSWKPDRLAAIERDSIVDAGGLKRVRISVIFAVPRTDRIQPYRGLVGLQEFDCAGGRYRTLESTPIDDAGVPILALAVKDPAPWVVVAPGTLGDDEKRRVCGGDWSPHLYATTLATLVGAYLLRPDPPPDLRIAAAPSAVSATEHAAEASAKPGP